MARLHHPAESMFLALLSTSFSAAEEVGNKNEGMCSAFEIYSKLREQRLLIPTSLCVSSFMDAKKKRVECSINYSFDRRENPNFWVGYQLLPSFILIRRRLCHQCCNGTASKKATQMAENCWQHSRPTWLETLFCFLQLRQ
jgi:hypothetical protein